MRCPCNNIGDYTAEFMGRKASVLLVLGEFSQALVGPGMCIHTYGPVCTMNMPRHTPKCRHTIHVDMYTDMSKHIHKPMHIISYDASTTEVGFSVTLKGSLTRWRPV